MAGMMLSAVGEDVPGESAMDERSTVRSDEQTMAAFRGGSRDAFEELFSRYKKPIFGFFRRRVGEQADAEDLTQETFLALFRAGSQYEATALFRTYLYAIALNVLRGHRRKVGVRAMFVRSVGEVPEPAERNNLDAGVVLRDSLARLNEMEREILLLREFEQMSYAEIAELLKLPLNTVRTRLLRARLALREMLGGTEHKEGV